MYVVSWNGMLKLFFAVESGECYTLGSNQFGQLGCRTDTATPRIPCKPSFPDDTPVSQVACGDMFTVAVTSGTYVFISSHLHVFICVIVFQI